MRYQDIQQEYIPAFRAVNAGRGQKTDALPGAIYFFPERSTAELWAGDQETVIECRIRIDKADWQAVSEGEIVQHNSPVVIRTDPEGSGKILEILVFDERYIQF